MVIILVMQNDLTKSSIFQTILKMAFPMSWGILSVIGFNLADTYFIGNLGKLELAAISLTFPVVMVFFSIALGMATATSSIIARSIGEKNEGSIKRFTSDSLMLAFFVVLVSVVAGLVTIDPVFTLLGASKDMMPIIEDYMYIWYPGMIFITIPMTGNGAIRARGDMVTASIIMIVASLTNIILDPIFIYGLGPIPAMGVKGAAIATVIARATTFIASLSFLHFKYKMIDFKRPPLQLAFKSWKKIIKIAIPTTATNLLGPISMAIVMGLIARMGEDHIAAFGIISRLESFALIFILALSSSIGPFVGQNFGAQKKERILKGINSSFIMSMGWGTLMAFILTNIGAILLPFFNSDDNVVSLGSMYFSIVPLTYGFFGIRLIVGSVFNALGKPLLSSVLVVINLVVIFIPLVFLGAYFYELKGIYYAQAITNIIIGAISYFVIKKYIKLEMNYEKV